MTDVLNTRMNGWATEMERKKLKHNIAGCWTAVILNPIWLIVDYFSAPDDWLMIALIDLPVSLLILVLILVHKKLRITANQIGVVAILALSIAAAFVCSQLELAPFQKLMISYTAIFIGAGMLVIMEMVYSIVVVVVSFIFNLVFFYLFSPLSLEEFLFNGGLLVALVAIFMVISIQIKYRLASRSVVSKLILSRNQEELISAKKVAEKSKEMQSQFLSNMSHEIRTPMNGIIGITRLLQGSELNQEQRHYLNTIIKSSENLMVIINDILDFSKIEAGKIVIEETRFNLDSLLSTVEDIFALKAKEKGIHLSLEKEDDVPTWVHGDSVRLNQILSNLISNAIKFTEKGGVTIRTSVIMADDTHATLWIRVKDTGIGIPETKLGSIFQSFVQASSSTTRTYGGTGLGLTITKKLIELQNGRLWVRSTVNKGTIFNFKLRYKIAANEKRDEEKIHALEKKSNDIILNELKGIDVLLVEDHPINQMLATRVLKDWGFNVTLAENGLIALDIISKNDFNLVLMDINMPEMDGYMTTKEIRSGKYTQNSEIPIIAMTASAFIGDNQKCFKAGMNDYISKPFNPQDLLEKISKHTIHIQKRA
jgi:signal transduction histidine kinase/CheY-like chemotaxis protein